MVPLIILLPFHTHGIISLRLLNSPQSEPCMDNHVGQNSLMELYISVSLLSNMNFINTFHLKEVIVLMIVIHGGIPHRADLLDP